VLNVLIKITIAIIKTKINIILCNIYKPSNDRLKSNQELSKNVEITKYQFICVSLF